MPNLEEKSLPDRLFVQNALENYPGLALDGYLFLCKKCLAQQFARGLNKAWSEKYVRYLGWSLKKDGWYCPHCKTGLPPGASQTAFNI